MVGLLLRRREEGQGMVEYGLMIGLISILVLTVFVVLGTDMVSQTGIISKAIGDEAMGEGHSVLSAALY